MRPCSLRVIPVLALCVLAPRGAAEAPVRTFEVSASRFEFAPAQIEVDEGDKVVLKVRSTDTDHGLAIKEFKVKAAIPKGGQVVTVEFVAAKPGSFRFACSEYCGNGHSRMKGTLVVRPKGGAQ